MKNISAKDFKRVLDANEQTDDVACIDVCSPQEYQQHHIEGVLNMPLETLPKNISSLLNKKTIYINCLSGGRSKVAAQFLEANGVTAEIYNIEGGLMSWHNAGLPLA